MPKRDIQTKILCLALCLLLPTARARAQGVPPAAPAPAPPTLAQALAQAEVSHDTVYLAVGAEKVTLPRDAAPPPPGAAISQVADAYGRITQAWETAGAVAPPTMTLLNANPGTPNPYDGVPPGDALKLLLGGLDDGQWRALTGAQGLAYAGLTTESQQQLFAALFPGGTLTARSYALAHAARDYVGTGSDEITLTANDLQQARLRLSQQVSLSLQAPGLPGVSFESGQGPQGGTDSYTASSSSSTQPGDALYGVQVRATIPNAPKPSDLDAAALTAPVALAGVKTVGQLIGRIGAATRTELYADVRYETRTVTAVGPASARAGDLLRALALCVTGTYRRVGPAYVLTDDVLGLGRRQMILARFAQRADMARAGALADAGDKLVARGGVVSLPPTEPGLEVTGAQQAAQKDNPFWGPSLPYFYAVVALDQLTPQQRDLARQEFGGSVTAGSTFLLRPQPFLQLLSPAVPGPVTLSLNISVSRLFRPSATLQARSGEPTSAQGPPRQQPAAPSLAALLAPLPRRAVLARPRTAREVDALIAGMRRVGLNQLWLDVFSEGKSRLDVNSADKGPDILAEALAKTRGTGIAVVPTLDLLAWGGDAPEDARDLTVLGETSEQDADYQRRLGAVTSQGMTVAEADALPPSETLSACPAAPAVAETLAALVRRLAATPGVAALALQDTVTPGYARAPASNDITPGDLGYTVPLRLACLRRTHLDPVDLGEGLAGPYMALPDFEDVAHYDDAVRAAGRQWDAVRAEADLALMRRLLATAQESAGRPLPFLVKQRGLAWSDDWWGLWAAPGAPLPALTGESLQEGILSGFVPFAHTQCRVDVYALPPLSAQSPEALVSVLRQMKPGWDGVVIDARAAGALTVLASGASPAPLPPVKKP